MSAVTSSGQDLKAIEKSALKAVRNAGNLAELEDIRVQLLGRNGEIQALTKQIGAMPPEEKQKFGKAANTLKRKVSDAIETRKADLKERELAEKLAREKADVTLPVRLGPQIEGRIHPLSQVWDEVTEIFADMGFAVAEGPDIETDDNNFTKLNIPDEHPARQEHDTFYFAEKPDGSRPLLRTHTSPVQIRAMLKQKPPLRIIAPGRVYRSDSDQTHTPQFHQVEGLVIDQSTHMGHLRWVLEEFCRAFFEVEDVKMRYRASHFPFTEPSMEVDISAEAIGKQDDWLEILGCGMVHPNVLRGVGLDPATYQGFAFGVGMDRLTMLKYGIPDLRTMFTSDLRWLRHYGFSMLDTPTLAGGLSQ
ncbi:MAG: phenylalanine--tRNA ligase subunit alpha [Dichotomicrobium sp.]